MEDCAKRYQHCLLLTLTLNLLVAYQRKRYCCNNVCLCVVLIVLLCSLINKINFHALTANTITANGLGVAI